MTDLKLEMECFTVRGKKTALTYVFYLFYLLHVCSNYLEVKYIQTKSRPLFFRLCKLSCPYEPAPSFPKTFFSTAVYIQMFMLLLLWYTKLETVLKLV